MHFLIDATNMAHRDYHATKADAGLDRIAGMVSARIKAIRERWKPSLIVAAFDSGPTFRHEIMPDYKAGRTKDDMVEQAIEITESTLLDDCVACVRVDGFEADDIVATFAHRALRDLHKAVIYSADKDLHQMIVAGHASQAVSIRRDRDQVEGDFITSARLVEKYGVTPEQWVDYRTMTGDESDGISGFEGVGPKTACQVLDACGTLDEFYRDPSKPKIGQSMLAKMLSGQHLVSQLREMLTLRRDVPLGVGW